jgi:hypothetical protein
LGIIYLHLYIFLQLLILLSDPFEALGALANLKETWDLPPVTTFANSALKRIRHACSAGFILYEHKIIGNKVFYYIQKIIKGVTFKTFTQRSAFNLET